VSARHQTCRRRLADQIIFHHHHHHHMMMMIDLTIMMTHWHDAFSVTRSSRPLAGSAPPPPLLPPLALW
jgi:hypothetical protein